jgi:hypothetical protein
MIGFSLLGITLGVKVFTVSTVAGFASPVSSSVLNGEVLITSTAGSGSSAFSSLFTPTSQKKRVFRYFNPC